MFALEDELEEELQLLQTHALQAGGGAPGEQEREVGDHHLGAPRAAPRGHHSSVWFTVVTTTRQRPGSFCLKV